MLFIYSFIFTVIVDKLKLVLSGSPRLLLANEGLSWGLALTGPGVPGPGWVWQPFCWDPCLFWHEDESLEEGQSAWKGS